MKILVLLGRILFSLIFLLTIPGHFSSPLIGYADSQGVPLPSLFVPLAGIVAFVGALSIIFGYKARLGAWLIIIFLVPVTFSIHAFWRITDPVARQTDMVMFMKNIALIGAALLIAYFGAGPWSVDEKMAGKRR
jgi:putative oxidoreductase